MADAHPIVIAYKEILDGNLANFLKLSQQIGGDVQTQAALIEDVFKTQLEFLRLTPLCKAPEQSVKTELVKPLVQKIGLVQEFREKNRPSKLINHLSAIGESIAALYWVEVSPCPGPHVKELIDAGQFYSNRVLMEYKDKDKLHVDWVKSWVQALTDLQQYIKQYHTTGVTWNPKGENAAGFRLDAASAQGGGGGGSRAPPPPPGPPPPPPPSFADLSLGQPAVGEDRAALFQQLNQGEDITKTLRKVTSDQQTHKNPNLRLQQPVATPGGKPGTAPRPYPAGGAPAAAAPVAKPSKFELQGKKWVVEYHTGNKNLVIGDTAMNQAVYIFSCNDCVVQVKGKVNSITMDACKKSSLVFHDIVASVEFVNCQRIQSQAMGKVPTVSIDKTDGIQVYLNKDTLDTELVTSKSSEINLLVPKPDGEFVEYPVPEQYKTKWTGKGLATVAVEQA